MDVIKHFALAHDPFRVGRDGVPDDGVLDFEDARRFIATRTAAAGRTDIFSPASLDVLAEASRGRPAALRLLAGNAMFHAAFDGARRVEETHARQAVATQDIWRDVPAAASSVTAPSVTAPSAATAMAAAAAATVAPRATALPFAATPVPVAPAMAAPLTAEPAVEDDLPPPRRSWWAGTPPLARLAMVVAMLLLSLPVVGYVVGAVKDDRPAADSSYLPDEGELAAADAEAPIDAAPELPPVAAPAPIETADAGPPIDLTAQTIPPEATRPERSTDAPAEAPVATGAGSADIAPVPTPATEPEPTVAASPRVFVHYSSEQPGAADAAAEVAGNLREQGFTVADIRAVPLRIDTASVRYFYPGDRAKAEALHDALGSALRGRGFSAGDLKSMTGYDPAPRRGTLEVWVPAGG